ncbi:MAG: hypothetical protein JO332_07330 [Planctomycetaceae bacterium]|nr:hypothetical protein [Planctomycetaceae bacterium]
MLFAGGGCLPKIAGAVVGIAVCGLMMALGLKDARAGGAACIAWGATVVVLSRKYPQYRNDRLTAWCVLIAGAGVATFLWPNYFNEKSRVSEHVSSVNDRLHEKLSGGTHPIAETRAAAARLWVMDFEKSLPADQKGEIRVYAELDNGNPKDVQKASVYVETAALRYYGPDRKTEIATQLVRMLQAEFPRASCNAAVRGPFQWGAKASAAPGQPPTVALNSEKPAF